jgi:hypothetical protein
MSKFGVITFLLLLQIALVYPVHADNGEVIEVLLIHSTLSEKDQLINSLDELMTDDYHINTTTFDIFTGDNLEGYDVLFVVSSVEFSISGSVELTKSILNFQKVPIGQFQQMLALVKLVQVPHLTM